MALKIRKLFNTMGDNCIMRDVDDYISSITGNRRVLPLAKKICADQKIDIIHQITPIEFRAIGDYGKIANIKFVCGSGRSTGSHVP